MSLVSTHTRRTVYQSPSALLEVDVARHLWSSARVSRLANITDPEHVFKQGLTASKTDVLKVEGDVLPNRINYRILEEGYSAVFIPVLFNNTFDIKLRSIKVNLPDKIRDQCFTINQFTDKNGDPTIVVDAITETGVLITFTIKILDFVVGSQSTLSTKTSSEWSKLSNPYGFDVRKPHIMHSYRPDYLIVFFRDGGIIAFQKDINGDVESVIFTDNSYLESLGQLFRPWANKNTFNGEKDLSVKTVIDVIHFNDYLITVTISRQLRIWSVSKQCLILEKDLAQFLTTKTSNSREFLDSTPTKLLDIFTTQTGGASDTSPTHYLTVFLPFGNGTFKLFSIKEDDFDIIDLGVQYEFTASLPDTNSIWLVGDFQLTRVDDRFELWVLWKSNTSSFVQQLQLDSELNYEWFGVHDSIAIVEKNVDEGWSEYYGRKIFQSGLYSKQVIETALPIFEKHFLGGFEDVADVVDDLTLFERVTKSISRGIESSQHIESTLERQFSRFDTLCAEFKKQADEPLKLYLDDKSGIVLVINRQEGSFVRPSSALELLNHNKSLKVSNVGDLKSVGDHLRFVNVISEFKASLSSDVFANVKTQILRAFTHPEKDTDPILASIYDQHLKDKFNPVNLGKLVEELSQFDNLFTLIDEIIKFQSTGKDKSRTTSSTLTALSISMLTETTRDLVDTNTDIMFSILILLLVLDFDDKTLLNTVSKRVIKLITSYEIFKTSLEINFNPTTGNVEVDEPVIPSVESLFTNVMTTKFADGFPVTRSNMVQFCTQLVIPFIQTNEFLYHISSFLISRDLSFLVYERFLKFYDDNYIFHLLKALVFFKTNQPIKAAKYFANYADEVTKHSLTPSESQIFKPLEEFAVLFGTNLGKYYLNIAIMFLNGLHFDQAEKFIALLSDGRQSEGFEKKYKKDKDYTSFTISVEKLDLVKANSAFKLITDPKLRSTALEKFISAMYNHQSIDQLIEFDSLRGDTAVDALLLKKAQSADIKRSLWFYQVLYAYRLNCGDFRGASEALYDFIAQHRESHDDGLKIAIAEMYSVILNIVGTLEKDDQWIIKHGEEQDVVSLSGLREEKEAFVNGLSREVRLRCGM